MEFKNWLLESTAGVASASVNKPVVREAINLNLKILLENLKKLTPKYFGSLDEAYRWARDDGYEDALGEVVRTIIKNWWLQETEKQQLKLKAALVHMSPGQFYDDIEAHNWAFETFGPETSDIIKKWYYKDVSKI